MFQKTYSHKGFRNIILFSIKVSLLLLILWFVGKSLYKSIAEVAWSTIKFQPVQFILGLSTMTSGFFVGTKGLQYIYRHLDRIYLSSIQAFILLSVPPLGKYLPSKIFALAGHTVIAKTFGIGMLFSGSITLLIMGFGLASATLIGMILLLFQVPAEFFKLLLQGCAAVIAIIIVLIIFPDIYWRMMNVALRLLKQAPITVAISPKTMAVLFVALLFQNGLYLLGVSQIVLGTVDLSVSILPTLVGAACLANVIGFLAIFAPAGIGVREGILLVMLTPMVGSGIAGLIAVMMRVIQTGADCMLGFAGVVAYHVFQNKNGKNIKSELNN